MIIIQIVVCVCIYVIVILESMYVCFVILERLKFQRFQEDFMTETLKNEKYKLLSLTLFFINIFNPWAKITLTTQDEYWWCHSFLLLSVKDFEHSIPIVQVHWLLIFSMLLDIMSSISIHCYYCSLVLRFYVHSLLYHTIILSAIPRVVIINCKKIVWLIGKELFISLVWLLK